MITLGIDVGLTGAIAVFDNDRLVTVHDMPTLHDGPAKRRSINGPLLADVIAQSSATRAYVELVGARPGEGPVGAFSFGRALGVIEGVCAGLNVEVRLLAPRKWKNRVGIPAGPNKDMARSEAIRRWPANAALFARVRDDGRAEAALIAVAGRSL
jgi:crossover junction endodeoxyribonuclease RuvC